MTMVALKDRKLGEYFEAVFEMYSTEGWKKILEDMGRLHEIYNDLRTCGSPEELHFRQGQLNVIGQILSHRERAEHAYKSALEEQLGTSVELTTGGVAKVIDPNAKEE